MWILRKYVLLKKKKKSREIDIYRRQRVFQVVLEQTEMAYSIIDECEKQLNVVSEAMDLLHIEVETDVVEDKPGREDAQYSVSLFNKPSCERLLQKHFYLGCLARQFK